MQLLNLALQVGGDLLLAQVLRFRARELLALLFPLQLVLLPSLVAQLG